MLRPSYLEISVPVRPHAIGYFWWETQYSELRYADEVGALYLFRQVGTAYADVHGWQTVDEASAYFDDFLRKDGWVEADAYLFESGDHILPESRFLKKGKEGFRVYTRPDDRLARGARVAFSIQSIPEVRGYEVAVVTAQPSWLRYLANFFDD